MKTLIVPDIHQRIHNVEKVLNKEDYDEVVFLGDWFDSFLEPPEVASFEDTCHYLKSLIFDNPNRKKFVFLIGNHDLNYIHNNNGSSIKSHTKKVEYYCSGYTQNKSKLFRKVFWDHNLRDEFFLENFKMAHRTQGWLVSHAGFIPDALPFGKTLDEVVDIILPDVWRNFRNLGYMYNYLISAVGQIRGGRQPWGGVLWLDWHYEMTPSLEVGNQIVGHTTVVEPNCMVSPNEKVACWNLDTELHYGVIENEKITPKRYADL
jgi:hypothetical protein